VGQRKILRDFKFPDPEGHAQALYYADARLVIQKFHRNGYPRTWLLDQSSRIRTKEATDRSATRQRLDHNARAIAAYSDHATEGRLQFITIPPLHFNQGRVSISVSPDLHYKPEDRTALVLLNYSVDPLTLKQRQVMAQLLFQAAASLGVDARPGDVRLRDCTSGQEVAASATRAKVLREIEATCDNIEAIWDSLSRSA
jgi:hypothetical protein